MSRPRLVRLILRLYPSGWRERYGEEYAAVLEQHRLDPRTLLDVAYGALDARLAGTIGRDARRHAALVVTMWALAAYLAAGVGFAKVVEYDDFTQAARHHVAIGLGSDLVRAGAALAALAAAAAAAIVLVAAVRARLFGPLGRAGLAALVLICMPIGLGEAAHSLPAGAHRPEDLALLGAWLLISVLVAGVMLLNAGTVVRRVALAPRRLRQAIACAWLACGGIATTLAGILVWGIGLRLTDRPVFDLPDGGMVSTPTAPTWIAQTALIALALVVTLVALLRSARGGVSPTGE